jgi:hypothetical protein
MLRALFVVPITAALLAACVSPPPPPPPQKPALPAFEGVQPPSPGLVRLYVFRPKSEGQELQHEEPVLRIGDIEVTPMPEGTYADVQLRPGRHTLSLVPPEGGADLWRTSLTLQLQRDGIYYVAYWMEAGFERTPSRNDATDTVVLVLPVGNPEETAAHLRVERPAAAVAEPILRRCCVQVFPPPVAPAVIPTPNRR